MIDYKNEINLLAFSPRLTVREAATIIGIPLRTLQYQVATGTVESFKSFGIQYITVDKVQQIIKNNQKD